MAERWKMLPSDAYQLYYDHPVDFAFMCAKVRADTEWEQGDLDIKKPEDNVDIEALLDRL